MAFHARSIAGWLQTAPLIVVFAIIAVIVFGNMQAHRELEQSANFLDRDADGNIAVLQFVQKAPPADRLKSVPSLQRLSIEDCDISSSLAKTISRLDYLTSLSLSGSRLESAEEGLLSQHSSLRELNLSGTSKNAAILLATELPGLRSLSLNGCTWLNDDTLAELGRFPRLEALEIANTAVTDTGLSSLKALQNLMWLNVSHCENVGETTLPVIGQLSSLRSVTMSAENLSLAAARKFQRTAPRIRMFTPLAEFPEFEPILNRDPALSRQPTKYVWTGIFELNVQDDSGVDYSALQHFPELRSLSMSGRGISDSTVEQLLAAEGVESLRLRDTQITDAALLHVAKMPHVHSLDLSQNQITDAGLQHLSEMTQLTWLDLSGTKLTANAPAHVRNLTSLVYLGLEGIELSEAGLEILNDLSLLSGALDLSQSGNSHIQLFMLEGAPLEAVDLTNRAVSDYSLDVVKTWSELRSLRLSGTHVTGEALDLSGNHNLTELYLDRAAILDSGLTLMVLPKELRHLSLVHTSISGDTLPALAYLDLWSLDLSGTALTSSGVAKAFALNPRALILKDVREDADLSNIDMTRNRVTSVTLSATSPLLANLAKSPLAKQLVNLHLDNANSQQMLHVGRFPRLQSLTLSNSSLDAEAFRSLAAIEMLATITLDHCELTQQAVGELALLENLRTLQVINETATLDGAEAFLESNPGLAIHYHAAAD